jgi:hypothetical protein
MGLLGDDDDLMLTLWRIIGEHPYFELIAIFGPASCSGASSSA